MNRWSFPRRSHRSQPGCHLGQYQIHNRVKSSGIPFEFRFLCHPVAPRGHAPESHHSTCEETIIVSLFFSFPRFSHRKKSGGTYLIQCFHRLAQFLDILLRLHHYKVADMAQLVFTHGMPSSNALVTSNSPRVALAACPDIILQNEILSNHPSSVPDELINIHRVGRATLWKSPIRALAVPLLGFFFRRRHKLRLRQHNLAQRGNTEYHLPPYLGIENIP